MALIEFSDEGGVEWRAWDITPADMHPLTAREMFHGETADYQQGWLVFQSATERRRLAPYPADWCDREPHALRSLLAQAQPVTRRPSSAASGTFRRLEDSDLRAPGTTPGGAGARGAAQPANAQPANAQPANAQPATAQPATAPGASVGEGTVGTDHAAPGERLSMRMFDGDGGRRWTVGVVSRESAPGESGLSAGRALRFTSDHGAVCELHPFPDDWSRLAREHLVGLLRRAEPVPEAGESARLLRRRVDFLP